MLDGGAVAPFTGAWIETLSSDHALASGIESRPSRARGLKPSAAIGLGRSVRVAPFTGAWIETASNSQRLPSRLRSRPSRARGLKPAVADLQRTVSQRSRPSRARGLKLARQLAGTSAAAASRPSRARGLKHRSHRYEARVDQVAPFTGAWIETIEDAARAHGRRVAPFTGAWIETYPISDMLRELRSSRPSRARGLKHAGSARSRVASECRALHGRVD